jgi:hypothetical protein
LFIGHRNLLTKFMHPAMDVGILLRIIIADGLNNLNRFLSGGSIIEIDKGFTVHLLAKNRKILSYLLNAYVLDRVQTLL